MSATLSGWGRIAALLLLAAHAVSSPAQEADVVLTMNSYGPVRIGMPVDEVRRELVKLGRKQLPGTAKVAKAGCDYYEASPHLRFMVEDGRIVRIETQEPNVVTPSGIRIGTSVARVRKLLGSRIEDMQQHYADDAAARTIVLVSGDGKVAIRVEAGETVTEIYTGAAHAIRYVEGCA